MENVQTICDGHPEYQLDTNLKNHLKTFIQYNNKYNAATTIFGRFYDHIASTFVNLLLINDTRFRQV